MKLIMLNKHLFFERILSISGWSQSLRNSSKDRKPFLENFFLSSLFKIHFSADCVATFFRFQPYFFLLNFSSVCQDSNRFSCRLFECEEHKGKTPTKIFQSFFSPSNQLFLILPERKIFFPHHFPRRSLSYLHLQIPKKDLSKFLSRVGLLMIRPSNAQRSSSQQFSIVEGEKR